MHIHICMHIYVCIYILPWQNWTKSYFRTQLGPERTKWRRTGYLLCFLFSFMTREFFLSLSFTVEGLLSYRNKRIYEMGFPFSIFILILTAGKDNTYLPKNPWWQWGTFTSLNMLHICPKFPPKAWACRSFYQGEDCLVIWKMAQRFLSTWSSSNNSSAKIVRVNCQSGGGVIFNFN